MKKFIKPEIKITELKPVETLMDDITLSAESPKIENEKVVTDTTDEAVW